MIYILLGEDRPAKEKKINELKGQHLTSSTAFQLDFDSLHATKLNPAELKKTLMALPAVARHRVVLIRTFEKLTPQNSDIVLDFIRQGDRHIILVLDSDESSVKGSLVKKIGDAAEVIRFGQVAKKSVFDMTRAMEQRDTSGALKILYDLLKDGNHPLQLIGGLIWFWGKSKNRLSTEGFKKGLLVLQEADLNIKRSRLKPEQAMELAVTKLSLLIAC